VRTESRFSQVAELGADRSVRIPGRLGNLVQRSPVAVFHQVKDSQNLSSEPSAVRHAADGPLEPDNSCTDGALEGFNGLARRIIEKKWSGGRWRALASLQSTGAAHTFVMQRSIGPRDNPLARLDHRTAAATKPHELFCYYCPHIDSEQSLVRFPIREQNILISEERITVFQF
jgi:hypothetical protein